MAAAPTPMTSVAWLAFALTLRAGRAWESPTVLATGSSVDVVAMAGT